MPDAKPKNPKKSPTRPKKTGSASSLQREEFLVRRLAELEADQEAARNRSSWIAVLQLGRDLDKAHAELTQLRASQGDRNALDPAALVAELEKAIRDESEGLPEEDVERLYLACCERLAFVPDGGPGAP